MKKSGLLLVVVILLVGNFSLVSASTIEFDPLPPSTVCNNEAIDITVKGDVPLTMTQQALCLISPPYYISFDLYLMEDDTFDDDEIKEHWSGWYSNDCVAGYYTWTFEDIVPSNWAGGTEGSQIEMYAKVDPEDVSGDTSSNRNIDTLYNCDCYEGSCCDISSRPYDFKSSGAQPTGATDYYFCDGSNSPTGTNYVKLKDYYCTGTSQNRQIKDTTKDTCGTCEYCSSGDSTCNYYSSSTACGTKDCDYLDTSCRNYNDLDKTCSSGSCVSPTCNSYTDEPKHTSCGSGQECNGGGSCITCTSHSYKQCSGEDVYWYDACDNKEEKYDDCGSDSCGWSGLPKCEGNNVVQKKECHDKGCSSNACYDNVWYTDYEVRYECQNGCENGDCINECSSDSDCGASDWIYMCGGGSLFGHPTEVDKLYKIYEERRCKYPGSDVGASYCYSDYSNFGLVKSCSEGCANGQCNEDACTDDCSSGQTRCNGNTKQTCGNYDTDACLEWPSSTSGSGNENCGSDYCEAWGANYCKNNEVYKSRTCHDEGCSSGACYDNTNVEEQLVQDCSSSCESGACVSAGFEGDTNGDCKVDIFDLAKVGSCYGKAATGTCVGADLNSDGSINIFDLATVGRYYGETC